MELTIHDQKVIVAWEQKNMSGKHLLKENKNLIGVFVQISLTKKKKIYIGIYDPTKISVNMEELIGLSVSQASRLIAKRKEKYTQMLTLLKGD